MKFEFAATQFLAATRILGRLPRRHQANTMKPTLWVTALCLLTLPAINVSATEDSAENAMGPSCRDVYDPWLPRGHVELECDFECTQDATAHAILTTKTGIGTEVHTGCPGNEVGVLPPWVSACEYLGPTAYCATPNPEASTVANCNGQSVGLIGAAILYCETPGAIADLSGGVSLTSSQLMRVDSLPLGSSICVDDLQCVAPSNPGMLAIYDGGAFAWFTCDEHACLRGGGHS